MDAKYLFNGMSIPDAIIVQQAITRRIAEVTREIPPTAREFKMRTDELNQMYDDLDRHIAGETKKAVRLELEKGKAHP